VVDPCAHDPALESGQRLWLTVLADVCSGRQSPMRGSNFSGVWLDHDVQVFVLQCYSYTVVFDGMEVGGA
jgi:hypothetical protein